MQHQPCRCEISQQAAFAIMKMAGWQQQNVHQAGEACHPEDFISLLDFANLHSEIATSRASKHSRGLSTHPCRAPENMSNIMIRAMQDPNHRIILYIFFFFSPGPFSRRCPWSSPPTRIRWQAYGSGQPGFASGHPPGVRVSRQSFPQRSPVYCIKYFR